MRPRSPARGRGLLSGTTVIVTGLAATCAALVYPVWSYADRSHVAVTGASVLSDQTVQTRYGPLSVLDRELVEQIRLAGLWQLPAGEQAERSGTTDAVRAAGQRLVDGDTDLDAKVRAVAKKLDIPLPDRATAEQLNSLSELTVAEGETFDRTFAGTVRLADAQLLTLVAQVRGSTQNSLVRDLADDANSTVLDHIEAVEDTGFVDYAALARSLAASPSPSGTPSVPPGPTADPAPASPLTPSGASTYTLPPAASSPPPKADSTS
ncbi:DUF4142 domain-containing protein [Streptomyces mangrovisoli]|uniref:Tat pathway signal sequence domain protein n=1 Tax=Streptomyces mangrovisoli TaxID=1428628 RepID=A0A1J4NJW9_9ACTN|nr:DUF4142 domain-containing protein [Streptomyces mangrovisoli]OIJ62552.1 Tat pathway signal sequence domain protein [Streptomyces mangrovisoli]